MKADKVTPETTLNLIGKTKKRIKVIIAKIKELDNKIGNHVGYPEFSGMCRERHNLTADLYTQRRKLENLNTGTPVLGYGGWGYTQYVIRNEQSNK